MLEEAFDYLPLKHHDDLKKIKRSTRNLSARYHPDRVHSVEPEMLQKELYKKYTDISSFINSNLSRIIDDWDNIKTDPRFDRTCIRKLSEYKSTYIKRLNDNEINIILKANDLETTGNRNELEERIQNNVPKAIAILNIEEHQLRLKYAPNIEDTLKKFPDNKLIRILELKNIKPAGDTFSFIKQIVSSIDENEINQLIKQVDGEIYELKIKLLELNENQLKLILDNNNFNSYGNEAQLITKILENVPISQIENNINKVSINKKNALKKLYSLTGKDNLSESFKQILNSNNLEIKHGIEIRERLIYLINTYQIEEKNIELKLTEFINKKSQEIIDDILNELYAIIGKQSINKQFLDELKKEGLNEIDGIQIKNEIVKDIKAGRVKKDNLKQLIDLRVQDKKLKLQNEKLDNLYKITGKTKINSSFKQLLSQHELDEKEGLNIKNELISLIKTNNIDKNEINQKLLELITLRSTEKVINECDMNYLNQIALINNLPKCNTKQKYVKLMLDNISSSFNNLKIKSDINEIDTIKERLVKLYKNQIEFILISNKLPSNGTKKELINKIISNIQIYGIKLIISEIDKLNNELNQLGLNEISFIVKKNNIKVTGTKDKFINEINKTLPFDRIKKDIKRINEIKSQLNDLNINELKFIAKSNNLDVKNDKNFLIDEIKTQIPIDIISEKISEISNIKNIVKSFNYIQRQHLLITNELEINSDNKTQINEILEKIDLLEILDFNKTLVNLKAELQNLSCIQLNYILTNHNLEISTDKSIQIDNILDNILIPFIKKDIQIIKSFENKINTISEEEIDTILAESKLRKSIDKKGNIKTIVENLSFDEINEYLSKNNNNLHSIEEIKNSKLICPIKIFKGKPSYTTEKHGNSRYLLLFDDEKSFNEYKNNVKSIKKFENDLNYFLKVINKNKKIEGILVRKTPEDLIFKKNQLN